MRIHFYTRDPQGLMAYHHEDGWRRLYEFLFDKRRPQHLDDAPEVEDLMGWPDDRVYWFRLLGIGSRTYESVIKPRITDGV